MTNNRKNKNKISDEVVECSAAANKRRRVEILNTTHGVPFTNPITQFPSFRMLQQQRTPPRNTTIIGTDLQLSPPSPPRQQPQPQQQEVVDDSFLSSLIPQQKFIIGFYTNQLQQNMEELWRRNVTEELKKVKEMDIKLKEKERQLVMFRKMYHYYEERASHLEEELEKRVNGEGCSNPVVDVIGQKEEVQSCFVDLNTTPQRMDMMCKHCRNRPAEMLWLPCRHLCVCTVCERRVKICPICKVKKIESLMINLPFN